MGTGGSFPGVQRQGREADHSPVTSAEVKKMWIYNPLPHTSSWRNAFTFTFTQTEGEGG
jgi:hypothetical protein